MPPKQKKGGGKAGKGLDPVKGSKPAPAQKRSGKVELSAGNESLLREALKVWWWHVCALSLSRAKLKGKTPGQNSCVLPSMTGLGCWGG